ncbi:hypothetical protein ADUPG1_005763, partial [Aduncisulcus paluster]
MPGPFLQAFTEGHWILLDELNLAQDSILQCLEDALDHGMLSWSEIGCTRTYDKHSAFRLIATQNPSTGAFSGKRKDISSEFLSRFTRLFFDDISTEECHKIVKKATQETLSDEDCNAIVLGHKSVVDTIRARTLSICVTLRDMIRASKAVSESVSVHLSFHLFYLQALAPEDR